MALSTISRAAEAVAAAALGLGRLGRVEEREVVVLGQAVEILLLALHLGQEAVAGGVEVDLVGGHVILLDHGSWPPGDNLTKARLGL
jgi:hypothetical protein